jgi:glycosyltransferase involved in cell wall biosynthesis
MILTPQQFKNNELLPGHIVRQHGENGLSELLWSKRGNDLSAAPSRQAAEVVMFTSFPPRECGIATFSQDLRNAICRLYEDTVTVSIGALEHKNIAHHYSPEVKYILKTDDEKSYKEVTLQLLHNPQIKAIVVQHEFGLFAEDCEQHFLDMLRAMRKPVILALHTVLPNPSPAFRERVINLSAIATRLVVMTQHSASLLQQEYGIAAHKIAVIAHGTHYFSLDDKETLKKKYQLSGRTVLSTFGLISRNKSIETTLQALPEVVKKYPQTTFLVLGRTHPGVVAHEGESYRQELEAMVERLGLQEHVRFVNRYLPLTELLEYLRLSDIYLFTSRDPHQAVSGTFAYALSAGCAIVSTPIPHAREILANGSGLLFDFGDSAALSRQILRYLDDPQFRQTLGEKALHTIAGTAWDNVAIAWMNLLQELCGNELKPEYRLPALNTAHLEKMTDGAGMIQFAHLSEPAIASGYTLDDNARALIASLMVYQHTGNEKMLELAGRYLNFIHNCHLPDGSFNNYVNEDGSFSERNHYENLADSNGRAIWALGYLISMQDSLPEWMSERANWLLTYAIPRLQFLESPRAIAFALKGLCYYRKARPHYNLFWLCETLAEKLVSLYKTYSDRHWKWFEPYLTYANSVMPEALLMLYQLTGRLTYKEIAKESFDFLLSCTFQGNRMKVISNKGWLHKGRQAEQYGEQPIDVAYTVLALDRFYKVFGNELYVVRLRQAVNWFLGDNHLHQVMYNAATGGCFDGLEEKNVNLNQGAESTVCWLMTQVTAAPYFHTASQHETVANVYKHTAKVLPLHQTKTDKVESMSLHASKEEKIY